MTLQEISKMFSEHTTGITTTTLFLLFFGVIALIITNTLLKRKIGQLEQKRIEKKDIGQGPSLPILRFFQRIVVPLSFLGILSIGINMFTFDDRIQATVKAFFSIIMTIIIVRSINKGIELSFSRYFEKEWANHEHEKNLKPLLSLIKFLLWVIGAIFLLANLGFDVSTAVAGLGVGGIAVAIAAQGILGDLFSYFVIFFDRPFELGDFIIFGDKFGTVEKIGIKSSRIRMLSGEILIISNSDLTSSRIHNYKQMKRRRVVFSLHVTYQTAQEEIEALPRRIREIIESVKTIEGVVCDRSHLQALGSYSLIFETVYFVPSPDYATYMEVQQEIYVKLFALCNERKIEFAYPTQKIHAMHETNSTPSVFDELIP